MSASPKPTYRLVIEALPNTIDPTIRLRSLLKTALRRFGFRCVRVEEVKDEAVETKGAE